MLGEAQAVADMRAAHEAALARISELEGKVADMTARRDLEAAYKRLARARAEQAEAEVARLRMIIRARDAIDARARAEQAEAEVKRLRGALDDIADGDDPNSAEGRSYYASREENRNEY